jgi:toluene monooxygenase electron transfer component
MKVLVRSKTDKFAFEVREGERILYAGLRHGLALPYECATGTCGTCKARVREPRTITTGWDQAPANAYLKPERGEFLMCQACAVADCEIAVPANFRDLEGVRPSHHTGRIASLRRLTHDVVAFEVELDPAMDFEPGQFVVLECAAIAGFRAYSMVNHAAGLKRLKFVAKSKPGGAFSEMLFSDRALGTEVRVFGPLGTAVFRPAEQKDVLCIAGGSGVAGMMAILSRARQTNYFTERTGSLFFGVRTVRDVFFVDELAELTRAVGPNLRVTIALSDEEVPADPRRQGQIEYATGFVHAVAAERMRGVRGNIVAFVAGPPPMVDAALRMLIVDMRLPANDIRYDKFG